MLIEDTETLRGFCDAASGAGAIAVDTEFLRERTYYARLCLVQVAAGDRAAAVDVLAPDLDPAPLHALLADPGVLKVFHSAGQDVEILLRAAGALPVPLYDTQIAAAFCGYGEQIAYARLAEEITGARIDKGAQMTDWSRRPLTERQVGYALEDVLHLGAIRDTLAARLEARGRSAWAEEEMASLADPAAYVVEPREQWRRVRISRPKRRTLAVLREVAAWREETAQRRDLPRGWVLKDDALAEIAHTHPADAAALERVRSVNERFARGRDGEAVLEAIARGLAVPDEDCPAPPAPRQAAGNDALASLLGALLRARAEEHGIASAMIANRADLDRIAAGDDGVRALQGWRRAVFGDDAVALREGRIALAAAGEGLEILPR